MSKINQAKCIEETMKCAIDLSVEIPRFQAILSCRRSIIILKIKQAVIDKRVRACINDLCSS